MSRERAYHGVNIGGVSLSGRIKNREAFPATMPHVALMRHTWQEENKMTRGQPEQGAELAEDLERICQTYGPRTIAACFIEPVAGSSEILVPPKGYLKRLREICDKHGILLVFGCHVKFTGDVAVVAPAFIAERGHVDEIVDKLRKTLDQHL